MIRMNKIPKVKKRVNSFLVGEEGKISKQSVLAVGTVLAASDVIGGSVIVDVDPTSGTIQAIQLDDYGKAIQENPDVHGWNGIITIPQSYNLDGDAHGSGHGSHGSHGSCGWVSW